MFVWPGCNAWAHSYCARRFGHGFSIAHRIPTFPQLDPEVTRGVKSPGITIPPPLSGQSVLARIQQEGEIRVGYNAGIIPFSYRNSRGELVGYDVSYAYELARDLNVGLRLIPFEWPRLAQNLAEGRFDIAMAGIYVTEDRLLQFKASTPYLQSPLALFMPRERAGGFTSRAKIVEREGVKIGVFTIQCCSAPAHLSQRRDRRCSGLPAGADSQRLTRPFGHWCRLKRWLLRIPG